MGSVKINFVIFFSFSNQLINSKTKKKFTRENQQSRRRHQIQIEKDTNAPNELSVTCRRQLCTVRNHHYDVSSMMSISGQKYGQSIVTVAGRRSRHTSKNTNRK